MKIIYLYKKFIMTLQFFVKLNNTREISLRYLLARLLETTKII